MYGKILLLALAALTGCGDRLTDSECKKMMDKQVALRLAELSPETREFTGALPASPAASFKGACDSFGKDGRAVYQCTMGAS